MKVFVLIVLCLLLSVECVSPGIKVSITKKGLDYAKDVGVKILLEKISTISIPNQSGEEHVPVIGHVDWNLDDIKINELVFPSNAVVPVPGKGLQLVIQSASAKATANWHYREHHWPHIKGHGSANVDLSGLSINVIIGFGEAAGEPTCTVVSESIHVDSVHIKVHGGPSWLYNLLLKLFKGKIKDVLSKGLEDAVTNGITNTLNDALRKIPVRQKVGELTVVDYSLTDAPRFEIDYLTVDGKGEFFDLKNPKEAPFTASALPDLLANPKMVQVAISNYLGDTAGFAFWKAGALDFSISAQDIPKDSPLQLNTNSFKSIVPELYAKYPGMNMSAMISQQSSPTVTVSTQGIQLIGSTLIDMFVIIENKPVPVFTLLANTEADGKAIPNGKQIFGNITDAKFNMKLTKTEIGTFDVTALNGFAEFIFEGVAIPYVDQVLGKGITIPTIPHIEFVSPVVIYGNNYIVISTDVTYTAAISDSTPPCQE